MQKLMFIFEKLSQCLGSGLNNTRVRLKSATVYQSYAKKTISILQKNNSLLERQSKKVIFLRKHYFLLKIENASIL